MKLFKPLLLLLLFALAPQALADSSFLGDVENIISNTSLSGRVLQLFALITIFGLAPSILIMTTSFVRIVIVLSIARTAIGLQQSPPNQMMVSLALFLTLFIMYPTFEEAYTDGLQPMLNEVITEDEALHIIVKPFKKFMLAQTRKKDIDLFSSIAKIHITDEIDSVPLKVVVPSFMISELRKGFEIGFLIFLPFIIIDIVVASVLMAMGMMMMPPVMIALPFKIIFFVLIDGWYLLAGSLVQSFGT
ncbi:MAG: flagellar type III secretion system pore protein FliP [Rickettsiaceae bacterium]